MAKRWFGYIQLDTIIKQKYNLAFSMELRISIGLYTLHIIPSFEKHTQDIASNTIHLFRQEIFSSSHHPPCRSPPWCQFVRYNHLFLPLTP